jgi:antirestriction protein ArdC
MTQHQIDAHASYLNSWCRVLESDERAVQIVASGAQRITDYLLSFAPRRLALPGKPSEFHSTQYRPRAAKKKRLLANDVPVPIATA